MGLEVDHAEDAGGIDENYQYHHRLKDAEKYRVKAKNQDSNESGDDERKADKPYSLFAQWSCMNVQNSEQAIEDDREEDGITNCDKGIAGMVTPKSHFHVAGKAESYGLTSQVVRFAGDKRHLANSPSKIAPR
jgi:hypothetical protein